MPIYHLSKNLIFPDPGEAEPNGLLAIGGDLSIERLMLAYSKGIFPWFDQDGPIMWWSPLERAVLLPGKEHFSRRTERALRSVPFEIRMDTAFEQIMMQCSEVPRKGQEGTWISKGMIKAYTDLHFAGYAHSVETWLEGNLVGGLYGVSLGSAFFGESMFSLTDYASRAAFRALCRTAWDWGFHFIDGQFPNENLNSLGAVTISREAFMERLIIAKKHPTRQGSWSE